MTDLLSQLQNATEGSRELSDQMLLACGWTYGYDEGLSVWLWRTPAGEIHSPHAPLEDPTRDLQDAVSLALESGATSISLQWRKGELAKALIGFPWDDGVPFAGSGYTLPLACSEAIIKAHEARSEAA